MKMNQEREEKQYDGPWVPDSYGGIEKMDEPEGESWQEFHRPKRRRSTGNVILLLALLLIFGVPLAGTLLSAGASVVLAGISLLVGIIGGLIGLMIGGFMLTIALAVLGIALIVSGCINMVHIPVGLMAIAGGFFCMAGSMLLAVLVKWGCGSVIPGLVRFCGDMVRICVNWLASVVRRVFGRAGGRR